MAERMKQRRGTADEWAAANPILAEGEIGVIEIPEGTDRIKIGDGVTAWGELPIFRVDVADRADRATDADSADNAKKLDDFDSSVEAAASTVVVRDEEGRIKTALPVDPDDAVSKAYADSFTAPQTKVEVFTVSGVYTKPADAKAVEVICIGGGGGGHGYSSNQGYAIGGAGGARVRMVIPASGLATNTSVSVGAGGASNQNYGGHGGDSSFGNLVRAGGGQASTQLGVAAPGGMPAGLIGTAAVPNNYTYPEQGGMGHTSELHTSSMYGGGAGGCAYYGNTTYRPGGNSGTAPGGAAGGSNIAGSPGVSRSGTGLAGSGGGGGNNGATNVGAPGGIPGGGGGGYCIWSSVTYGGPGGRGEVIVITYF